MASKQAIRFIAASINSRLVSTYLQFLSKSSANKQREGSVTISDETSKLRVAAVAREGEANKATREAISGILKALKSSVEVIRGLRSKEKTVAIFGIDTNGDVEGCVERIRLQLKSAR